MDLNRDHWLAASSFYAEVFNRKNMENLHCATVEWLTVPILVFTVFYDIVQENVFIFYSPWIPE